jgi:hypothetical protein
MEVEHAPPPAATTTAAAPDATGPVKVLKLSDIDKVIGFIVSGVETSQWKLIQKAVRFNYRFVCLFVCLYFLLVTLLICCLGLIIVGFGTINI